MKISHVFFIVAAVSALFAASFSLAQVTYQNQWCFSTPVPVCQNQCGCPIPNTGSDFCLNGVPLIGQNEVAYYYCTSASPGFTCTALDPTRHCGTIVLNCSTPDPNGGDPIPCGCCGVNAIPNCMNNCWNCTGPCIRTNKPNFCGQSYGCTGTHP